MVRRVTSQHYREINIPSRYKHAALEVTHQVGMMSAAQLVLFAQSVHRQLRAGLLQPSGPLAITTTCPIAGHAHPVHPLVQTEFRQIAAAPASQHRGLTGGIWAGTRVNMIRGTPTTPSTPVRRHTHRPIHQSRRHKYMFLAALVDGHLVHTHVAIITDKARVATAMGIIRNSDKDTYDYSLYE